MICYKERNLFFCSLYGVWGDDFQRKKVQMKKKIISFFITFNLLMILMLLLLPKRQSERSGLQPDTSSLFNPTTDTKVTEYLSGFFSSVKLRVFNWPFWTEFVKSFEIYCCPELKFEKIFHLWLFFVRFWGFKDCNCRQFGTINARYSSRY